MKIIYRLYIIFLVSCFVLLPDSDSKVFAGTRAVLDHFKTANVYPHCAIVKKFDRSRILKLMTRDRDYTKEIELIVFNDKKQVLRFNVGLKNDLICYNYGLAFELHEFDEYGYIENLYYYDAKGMPFGDGSVDDVARREFVISDYKWIDRKFRMIEGSRRPRIELPERASHVTMVLYDSAGIIIDEEPVSSVDYWHWCKMNNNSLKTPSF